MRAAKHMAVRQLAAGMVIVQAAGMRMGIGQGGLGLGVVALFATCSVVMGGCSRHRVAEDEGTGGVIADRYAGDGGAATGGMGGDGDGAGAQGDGAVSGAGAVQGDGDVGGDGGPAPDAALDDTDAALDDADAALDDTDADAGAGDNSPHPSVIGCRSPLEDGCRECVNAFGTFRRAASGADWYHISSTEPSTLTCKEGGCPACAECSLRDETHLLDLLEREDCRPCGEVTVIDPCFSPYSCACYCARFSGLSDKCPHLLPE